MLERLKWLIISRISVNLSKANAYDPRSYGRNFSNCVEKPEIRTHKWLLYAIAKIASITARIITLE